MSDNVDKTKEVAKADNYPLCPYCNTYHKPMYRMHYGSGGQFVSSELVCLEILDKFCVRIRVLCKNTSLFKSINLYVTGKFRKKYE